MNYLFSLLCCLTLFTLNSSEKKISMAGGQNTFEQEPVVIVQLFTSQGCSSCPPADALLAKMKEKYAENKNVILMAYHVDYWDRLGWKDPFNQK